MDIKIPAKERGRMISARMSIEATDKFDKLYNYRLNNGLNSVRSDILSKAVTLLYEKELGNDQTK